CLAGRLGSGAVLARERDGERIQLIADRPGLLEERLLCQLVAPAPALEEPIARFPEPLPQWVVLRARKRAALLPLDLQALHDRRGRIPVGRVGEGFGLLAERRLRCRGGTSLAVQ